MVYDGGVLFLSLFKWNWENSPYSSYGKNIIIMFIIIILISSVILLCIVKYKKMIKYRILNIDLLQILLSIFLFCISLLLLKGLRISSSKDMIIAVTIILISFLVFIKNFILYLSNYKKIILNIFVFIFFIFSFNSILNINKSNFNFIGLNTSPYLYNLESWRAFIDGYSYDHALKKIMYSRYINDNIWNSLFFWSKNTKSVKKLLKQIDIEDNQLYKY